MIKSLYKSAGASCCRDNTVNYMIPILLWKSLTIALNSWTRPRCIRNNISH